MYLHPLDGEFRFMYMYLPPLDGEFRIKIITKNVQISENSYLFAFLFTEN